MTSSREMLEKSRYAFAELKVLLSGGQVRFPDETAYFERRLAGALELKRAALTQLDRERFYLSPDPVPQVTAHCPFCGRWYRDDRTSCTDGCGGTLTEVKRVSLKARRVSFSNIPVIGADRHYTYDAASDLYSAKAWPRRFLESGLGPNDTRASVEAECEDWPHATPTKEVKDGREG